MHFKKGELIGGIKAGFTGGRRVMVCGEEGLGRNAEKKGSENSSLKG